MKEKIIITSSCKLTDSDLVENLSKGFDIIYKIIKNYLKKKNDNS